MTDDTDLLRRYVESRSERDFTVLVQRHLALVYHAALRRTGRQDLAQDIAQQVFTTLALEAPKLLSHPSLAGWLFTATRHATSYLLRTEKRRQARETDAAMTSITDNAGEDAPWDKIRSQLDEVMDQLSEQDRTALFLRFFHQQAFADIGRTIGLTEDTARKRVERALERLRIHLSRRGITSTALALGAMLANQTAAAAPSGMVATISAGALLPGATSILPAHVLATFVKTKLTLSLATTLRLAGLLCLPPAGLALYQHHRAAHEETIAANAAQENEYRHATLASLQRQLHEASRKIADLKTGLDQPPAGGTEAAPPPSSSATQTDPAAEARRAAEEFFAQFPEARRMLLELSKAQIHANYDGFYRDSTLTSAQIEELGSRTAQLWIENLEIGSQGHRPLKTELPKDELLRILGEENVRQFQEYNRGRTADRVARTIAVMTSTATTPLSVPQTDALVQAIQQSSDAYQNGESLSMRNVDWAKIGTQAQTFLTPEQWRVARSTFLNAQLDNATNDAQRKAASTSPTKN